MDMVTEVFKKLGLRYVLITHSGSGGLFGMITKKDVLRHLSSLMEEGSEENWRGIVGRNGAKERAGGQDNWTRIAGM